jgi:2,3-bisphosphoglycerate-independent phosphoglycerate mutase
MNFLPDIIRKRPLVLCILDGVGLNPRTEGNAVKAARTPTLDRLFATCPHAQLLTHGPAVGLPEGQMGNSEVGHLNLGAGRVLLQPLERVETDLHNGAFAARSQVKKLLTDLAPSRAVHLFGLVSEGGVHSHMGHLLGIAKVVSALGKPIYVHAILDGRDTAPRAAADQVAAFAAQLAAVPNTHLADLCGRFYAMDRDKRWERTSAAYALYTEGTAPFHAAEVASGIAAAYARDEGDEFVQATTLAATAHGTVRDGDGVVFCNFRADRMRQLVRAFTDPAFDGFARARTPKLTTVATLTEYDATFAGKVTVLYPSETYPNLFAEIVSKAGLTQHRLAETEKYAHVTFFFNGGHEDPYPGETRTLIPSPKVRTYDLQPEMSLPAVTDAFEAAVANGTDVIIVNVANGDMVGHTGNFAAGVKAVEAIDAFLTRAVATVAAKGGHLIITADHGNVEEMTDPAGATSTAHSLNPVPILYVGAPGLTLRNGRLCDVAPTLLALLGLPVPPEMEGLCLLGSA